MIEKATEKKKGKLYFFFIDLKAVFAKIDREKLWKTMEKASISKELVDKTREIYIDQEQDQGR